MLLRVVGKRNKERIVPLSEPTLEMLRQVWKLHRSQKWLFPHRGDPTRHVHHNTIGKAIRIARGQCLLGDTFNLPRNHQASHQPTLPRPTSRRST